MGLQVSVALGNLLTFPLIIIAATTGTYFGAWSGFTMLLAIGFSVLVWALLFGLVGVIVKRLSAGEKNIEQGK